MSQMPRRSDEQNWFLHERHGDGQEGFLPDCYVLQGEAYGRKIRKCDGGKPSMRGKGKRPDVIVVAPNTSHVHNLS